MKGNRVEKREILEILEFEEKRYAAKAKLSESKAGDEYIKRAAAMKEARLLIESLSELKATQSFEIKYPESREQKKQWAKNYGTNAYYAGKHWAARRTDAEFWHWMVKAAAGKVEPVTEPAEIYFTWDDALDVDNHSIMGKMITDALKGTVIRDDDRRYLKTVSHGFNEDNVIRVQIRELKTACQKRTEGTESRQKKTGREKDKSAEKTGDRRRRGKSKGGRN